MYSFLHCSLSVTGNGKDEITVQTDRNALPQGSLALHLITLPTVLHQRFFLHNRKKCCGNEIPCVHHKLDLSSTVFEEYLEWSHLVTLLQLSLNCFTAFSTTPYTGRKAGRIFEEMDNRLEKWCSARSTKFTLGLRPLSPVSIFMCPAELPQPPVWKRNILKCDLSAQVQMPVSVQDEQPC